jgi:hypothetical protein
LVSFIDNCIDKNIEPKNFYEYLDNLADDMQVNISKSKKELSYIKEIKHLGILNGALETICYLYEN